MRLIDADATKARSNSLSCQSRIAGMALAKMNQLIDSMPTVDAVPVRHGKWIPIVDTDAPMHECSVCGARVVKGFYEYDNQNKYCYHCGAKTDLEM